MSERPTYYECGQCKTLHRATFHCTSHTPRWKREDLNKQFGADGWQEIQEADVVEWRRQRYADQVRAREAQP